MARSLRLQYPGAFYHVIARGGGRGAIFRDDEDRRFFVQSLEQACSMTGWRVHAWVLLDDHYHLFLQTPEPNLVPGMSWLQNALTRRHNLRYRARSRSRGRVFEDRYKAVLVEGSSRPHYQALVDYIHLNPVRARLVEFAKAAAKKALVRKASAAKEASVADYPWSSLAAGHLLAGSQRPRWLATVDVLQAFELEDSAQGRRRFLARLDQRAATEEPKRCGLPPPPPPGAEQDARRSHLRRGWFWGTDSFAEKMRRLASNAAAPAPAKGKGGRSAATTPVRAPLTQGRSTVHGQRQAQTLLRDGIQASGLANTEITELKGSDPRKLLLADLLWRHTTVSQDWLAEKLAMRSAANVSQQLRRLDRTRLLALVPASFRTFLRQKARA